MHTVDIIQWIIIAILAAWLVMVVGVVSLLSVKVERILESGWFPEPRENEDNEVQ